MHKYLDWFNVALYLIVAIGCINMAILSYMFVTVQWVKVLSIIVLGLCIGAAIEELLWEIDIAKERSENG